MPKRRGMWAVVAEVGSGSVVSALSPSHSHFHPNQPTTNQQQQIGMIKKVLLLVVMGDGENTQHSEQELDSEERLRE